MKAEETVFTFQYVGEDLYHSNGDLDEIVKGNWDSVPYGWTLDFIDNEAWDYIFAQYFYNASPVTSDGGKLHLELPAVTASGTSEYDNRKK